MAEAGFMRDARGRGERGASFPFSLLLFLICTIAASLVLVSGTAAAGRVAGLADGDRLYYAVSSAAAAIQREAADRKVVVEIRQTGANTPELYVDGSIVGPSTKLGLLQWASVHYLIGQDAYATGGIDASAIPWTSAEGLNTRSVASASPARLSGVEVAVSGASGMPPVTMGVSSSGDGALSLDLTATEGTRTSEQSMTISCAMELGDVRRGSGVGGETVFSQECRLVWNVSAG